MIQAKCIQKFRDNSGKICGYRLQDLSGNTKDIQPNNLKVAIRNKQIHVVNLTLTKDNRLVDAKENKLQSKVVGKATVAQTETTSNSKYSDVAEALVLLDKELICIGDSYTEVVENRVFQSGDGLISLYSLEEYYENPEYADCNEDDDKILDKILYKAYLKMLNSDIPEIESIIKSWDEYESYDIFEGSIQYENVDSINKSKIYKALYLVYKYTKENKLNRVAKQLYDFLNRIKTTGVAAINIGYNAGHNYYTYLNRDIFGTLSNDFFTVGHTITTSDVKEHKEYKGYNYIFNKDINRCGAPQISLAALFKNADAGRVQVDIKIERHGYLTESRGCVGIRGYILDIETLFIDTKAPLESYSQEIANKFNELVSKLYDLADVHQSLYSSLGYNKPLEVVSLDDLNSHGTQFGSLLVNKAISRWTEIRGDKTPAKEHRSEYNSDTNFRILYANNVSDCGNDRKLYIEYNGSKLTLRVVNGSNINDIVIEETAEMTGSVVDNSPLISEVIAKALISANVRRI